MKARLFAAVALGVALALPASAAEITYDDQGPVCVLKELRWYRTAMAWHAHQKLRGGRVDLTTNGFYRVDSAGVCHIYAPDPPLITLPDGSKGYAAGQWGTAGHELKHCCDGRFHSRDGAQ